MRLFGLLLTVVLACSLLISPSSVEGQDSKSQQPSTPSVAAPLLRRVVVAHLGFGDATLNGSVLNEQDEYVKKYLEDGPRVETTYDQKKTDRMKKVLEDFWKGQGIAVEVRSILKPVPRSTRYAILEFDVFRR